MEDDVVNMDMNGSESPVSEASFSGEYYYLKALSYLATPAEGSSDDGHCSCLHCTSSEDKMDDDEDHFTTGFRPGLTLDDLHGCTSTETHTLSQYSTSPPCSSSSSSEPLRQSRKNGEGRRTSPQTGSGDSSSRKSRLKRKLSDGHVHWADEFQKDLARCHPRKSYTRHPSLHTSHVKPILKASPDDEDDQN